MCVVTVACHTDHNYQYDMSCTSEKIATALNSPQGFVTNLARFTRLENIIHVKKNNKTQCNQLLPIAMIFQRAWFFHHLEQG